MVPCVRINRVLHCDAGVSVVAVVETGESERVVSEDCIRAIRPDRFYYLPQQLPVGFKLAVGMVQEHDVLHADDGCRL